MMNRQYTKFVLLALLLSLSSGVNAAECSGRRRANPTFPFGGSLFDVVQWPFDDFFHDFSSDYHRDVMEHLNRQHHCANLCASRNREIRQSSIANAPVSISSDDVDGVGRHTIKVDLPGVKSSDVKVAVIGDVLKLEAEREWTDSLLPKQDDKVVECNCKDIASSLKGKKDKFERQLRLPKSVARDAISVEMERETGVLKIVVPEREPETISLKVLEVSKPEEKPELQES